MFRYPGAFLLCVFLPLSAPVLADAGRRPRPVATAIGAAAEAIPEAPLKHSPLSLTAWERDAIGRQIWFNESRASHAGLTVWNPGEGFPSLGIGHFIWYPVGHRERFVQSWPAFVEFALRRGARPPAWVLAATTGCPWRNRDSFYRDFHGAELSQLRDWLAGTVSLQTDFIIHRSLLAFDRVRLGAGNDSQRIERNYMRVAATPNGQYALIDYVNFKGEGISESERYAGAGWGLLQVLDAMPDAEPGQAAVEAFALAARRMLERRIANSPPERNEARWREGWHRRLDTYLEPLRLPE